MIKKTNLLIVLVLGIFLITASYAAPAVASEKSVLAAAGTTELTVYNETGVNIAIELTGAKKYSFTAYPGKTKKNIDSGNYKYQAKTVCGKLRKGNFKAITAKVTMYIPKCPESELLIDTTRSKTGVTLNLSGPRSYTFRVGAETTQTFKVWKGNYTATASWCGTTRTFQLKLNKNNQVSFSCP